MMAEVTALPVRNERFNLVKGNSVSSVLKEVWPVAEREPKTILSQRCGQFGLTPVLEAGSWFPGAQEV